MAKNPQPPALAVVQTGATVVQPPRKLGPSGTQFWNEILAEFVIEDRAGIELLLLAAEATDRAQDLAERIRVEGSTIRTKTGVRAHPALRDELANRAFVAKAIERLGLNLQAVRPNVGRPPRVF
jgi:hypothetical protein